ncbi:MAG: response regulator [Candidatus Contendobacter sp.]
MEKKTYAVALIGITEAERNVLRNIFKLSQYRAYSYTVAMPGDAPKILLVDADDPQAMQALHLHEGATTIPTIMVTKEQSSNAKYYVRRPFVASRVINTLDQVAQQNLQGHQQERIIGVDEGKKAPLPLPTLPEQARSLDQIKEKIVGQLTEKIAGDVSSSHKAYTALVVDDSSPVRRQLEIELKLFGIDVDAAATGEEGIEFFSHKNYNLIFLDVVLPGIDGYQICKLIKRDKARKKTPVIMLTSKSSPFDRVKGALAGCDSYLTKPVKQDTFQKVVKKYLK